MSSTDGEKIDITGWDWDDVNWSEVEWSRIDWSVLSDDQKARLRGIKKIVMKRKRALMRSRKAARRAQHLAQLQIRKESELVKVSWESRFDGTARFGDLPPVTSQFDPNERFEPLSRIAQLKHATEWNEEESFVFRARLHRSRAVAKFLLFLILRESEGYDSVQAVVNSQVEGVSREMVKFGSQILCESILELEGTIVRVENPTRIATISGVEIQVSRLFVLARAADVPLRVQDAMLVDEGPQEHPGERVEIPSPPLTLRLDHRYLDLRAPAHKAIFRISSGVGQLFREYLDSIGFFEIHTPRLSSRRGLPDVFKVEYFDSTAFLAPSALRHMQMAIMSDFERVFEIGPVFREVCARTWRHLTEFTSLAFEMRVERHYHEILDVLEGLFSFVFEGLRTRFAEELAAVQLQYPFAPVVYEPGSLVRLSYSKGISMLQAAGRNLYNPDCLCVEEERFLAQLVKENLGTDFFVLDKCPSLIQPFQTMPDLGNDRRWSNSCVVFVRGVEVASAAQRIHDPRLLLEMARLKDVDLSPTSAYVESLEYGAWPHGGAAIGLERLLMCYLGIHNIRKVSMFPRDSSRLTP